MMTAASKTSIVVDIGDGTLGIMTDRDLRSRVDRQRDRGRLAGVRGDVGARLHLPARTVSAPRCCWRCWIAASAICPVVSATGEVLGVIKDSDLVAMQSRTSFFLRQRIARAETVDELVSRRGRTSARA